MMAPEGGASFSASSGETIPIQHADGTVTCNGATVTTTTTSSSASGEQPVTHTSSSTVQSENAKLQHTGQEKASSTDESEDVTTELKQQKMKESVAKMNELGFVGEWVEELLKSVDG